MKTDKEIATETLNREFHVTTISWSNIEWFKDECSNGDKITLGTARTRLRNALNSLHIDGFCDKNYLGTSYYQTSDTLGGKVCICYSKKF